jgi:hypothetical protein
LEELDAGFVTPSQAPPAPSALLAAFPERAPDWPPGG